MSDSRKSQRKAFDLMVRRVRYTEFSYVDYDGNHHGWRGHWCPCDECTARKFRPRPESKQAGEVNG